VKGTFGTTIIPLEAASIAGMAQVSSKEARQRQAFFSGNFLLNSRKYTNFSRGSLADSKNGVIYRKNSRLWRENCSFMP